MASRSRHLAVAVAVWNEGSRSWVSKTANKWSCCMDGTCERFHSCVSLTAPGVRRRSVLCSAVSNFFFFPQSLAFLFPPNRAPRPAVEVKGGITPLFLRPERIVCETYLGFSGVARRRIAGRRTGAAHRKPFRVQRQRGGGLPGTGSPPSKHLWLCPAPGTAMRPLAAGRGMREQHEDRAVCFFDS